MNLPSIIPPPSQSTFDADRIAASLYEKGFSIIDNFLDVDASTLDNIYAATTERVNSEATLTNQSQSIRRDLTCDVDPLANLHGLVAGLESVCRLIQFYCCRELSRALRLDLYCRERPQLAYYPGEYSFYCRHFDQVD